MEQDGCSAWEPAVTPGYRAGLFLLSLLGVTVVWGASQGVSLPFSKSHCELGFPCNNGGITAGVSSTLSAALAYPALGAAIGLLAHLFCALGHLYWSLLFLLGL